MNIIDQLDVLDDIILHTVSQIQSGKKTIKIVKILELLKELDKEYMRKNRTTRYRNRVGKNF